MNYSDQKTVRRAFDDVNDFLRKAVDLIL